MGEATVPVAHRRFLFVTQCGIVNCESDWFSISWSIYRYGHGMFYSLAVGINMSRDVTKTTSQLSLRGTHSGPAPSVRLREASK